MSTIIPMTQYGAELLRSELEQLKTVARHEVISEIAEARAHGDLKENAEYHAAKEKQAFIEGRIREIEDKLSRSRVIDISGIPCNGKVIFGSIVKLNHLENGIEVTYRIVGDDEADLKQNKISISSPIARAIISKCVGEEVVVTTPQGEFTYEIISVEYV